MTRSQEQVKEWMVMVGQHCPPLVTLPIPEVRELRATLIQEELDELKEAFASGNIVKIADALGDLQVVVEGTAVACGIDLEPVFDEVMRSNFTKLIDGYRRPDGKWMKGKSYDPPKLEKVLDEMLNQQAEHHERRAPHSD